MNQGVEIIMARMDSHPQEFCHETMYGRYGRWTAAIDKVLAVAGSFTDEERKAISTKLYALERERFTQDVMKKLLHDPEDHAQKSVPYTAEALGRGVTKTMRNLMERRVTEGR
jgi:hypothetical protein